MDNILEEYRLQYSKDEFRNIFYKVLEQNEKGIMNLLNQDNLSFNTLFILIPCVKIRGILNKLNNRNQRAIEFCESLVYTKNGKVSQVKDPPLDTLRWIFYTGIKEDGYSEIYDTIIDKSIGFLILKHEDMSILESLTDLIFTRHREGRYYHDIVSYFFDSRNPIVFKYIYKYLNPNENSNFELANKLLKFIDTEQGEVSLNEKPRKFQDFIQENLPYIYFTDESFQMDSEPSFCKVNKAAKYIDKEIDPKTGELKEPLDKKEREYIKKLILLEEQDQKLLCQISSKLNKKNNKHWKRWLRHNIHRQIEIGLNYLEGLL